MTPHGRPLVTSARAMSLRRTSRQIYACAMVTREDAIEDAAREVWTPTAAPVEEVRARIQARRDAY